MSNELIVYEQKQIENYFKVGGMKPVLDAIDKKVDEFTPDMTTIEGRKAIGSLAYKISRSKTYLTSIGKELNKERKKLSEVVDAENRVIATHLDNLRDNTRKELNTWENKEKERVETLASNVSGIEALGLLVDDFNMPHPLEFLKNCLEVLEDTLVDSSWDEFETNAKAKLANSKMGLKSRIKEMEQEEATRKKKVAEAEAKAEADQKAKEKRIAKEAADKAKADAEAKALKDKLAAEAKVLAHKKMAEDKARAAKEAAEAKVIADKKIARDKAEAAKEAAEAAIANERLRAEQAEKRAKQAAIEAKAEAFAKIEAERKRVENEKNAEIKAEAARAADVEHRKKINNTIKDKIIALSGISEKQAKAIIIGLAKGDIPNTKLSY